MTIVFIGFSKMFFYVYPALNLVKIKFRDYKNSRVSTKKC